MEDTKISALTDGVTANASDRIPVTRNPTGTPVNRFITPAYIGKAINNSPLLLPATTGPNMRMVSPVGVGLTSSTFTAGRLYFVPVHFGADRTLSTVAIYVGSAAASGVARLGLYEDAGGVPGAFVADFGEVSTATTGLKEINISQPVLGTKWYWLAVHIGTANPVLVTVTTPVMQFGAAAASGSSGYVTTMFQTLAYGPLPTSNQAGASYTRTNGAVAVYWS